MGTKTLLGALLFSLSLSAQAIPIVKHIVENGQLVGAENVNVNGVWYDVKFADGTCIDLFSGCDENSDFIFSTFSSVQMASEALIDQVLVDLSPELNFDSDPSKTFGCDFITACRSQIPFRTAFNSPTRVAVSGPTNYRESNSVGISGSWPDSWDTTRYGLLNFAVWTEKVHTIPEPSTIALLGLGLLGIGWTRSKKPQH